VVAIDLDPLRLDFAQLNFGSLVVNGNDEDPVEAVKRLIPGGPDKVIDCVGFRFPDSYLHKFEQMLKLETDSPNIVNSAIKMVRKNGVVTLIGDYVGYTNQFNLGAMMEKHLTMNGGQLWPQKYYKKIFEAI
jgi:threonine dehydrogenase-like Zn-dependent dehydrogenase